jgi:hypothetical protein
MSRQKSERRRGPISSPTQFVDRQLFVDLLAGVGRLRDFSKYIYISMGGKFLEDHRALQMALDVSELISIDANPEVVARQDFNKPVRLHEMSA